MAALAATLVWEVHSDGLDTNGGGFNTARGGGGVDMTYPTSAPVTITATLNCSSSTTLTDSGNNFLATMVGNTINIAGTIYEITAFGSTGSVTIHTAGGALTNATGTVGGAVLTPGFAGGKMVAGNTLWIKAGTYPITSVSTNVASGCLAPPAGLAATATRVIGYQTTRGDGGTKPLLQAGGIATFQMVLPAGGTVHVENLSCDGASLTGSMGFYNSSGAAGVRFYRCAALNCKAGGFTNGGTNTDCILCSATGCATTAAFKQVRCYGCVAFTNTISGFAECFCDWCLAVNNTGASSDGFTILTTGSQTCWRNCTAYGNGRFGFEGGNAAGTSAICINCLAVNHVAVGAAGFSLNSTYDFAALYNCAGFNNTVNVNTQYTAGNNVGFLTLTVTPFTNAAGGDFSLNNTTGGGAACRAAGLLGAFPGVAATTGRQDVGAVQHVDPITRQPRFRVGTGS